jgi:hypothetical protein
MNEEKLVEFTSGVLQTQIVILLGMIRAKLVDPVQMRDWIQSLIDDLEPRERQAAYGHCLQQVVFALEKNALPRPIAH